MEPLLQSILAVFGVLSLAAWGYGLWCLHRVARATEEAADTLRWIAEHMVQRDAR